MSIEPSLTIRASAFSSWFDCAYRAEGIYLLGMKNIVGMKAVLGTAIHAGTAVFDTARINGDKIKPDDAVGVVIDKLHNPDYEHDPNKDDLTLRDASNIGIKLTTKYCSEVSPKYNFAAVEMETKPLDIDCGHGTVVRLTGTMDRARIRKNGEDISIADIKTGGTAVQKDAANTKGHGAQIGTYELLFEHTTGQPITADAEIIGMSTTSTARIATGAIKNAKQIITGTQDQPGLLEFAADMFRQGRFLPNPKSLLCSERYCPRFSTCHFRER